MRRQLQETKRKLHKKETVGEKKGTFVWCIDKGFFGRDLMKKYSNKQSILGRKETHYHRRIADSQKNVNPSPGRLVVGTSRLKFQIFYVSCYMPWHLTPLCQTNNRL
jgi:hypothetical protein